MNNYVVYAVRLYSIQAEDEDAAADQVAFHMEEEGHPSLDKVTLEVDLVSDHEGAVLDLFAEANSASKH